MQSTKHVTRDNRFQNSKQEHPKLTSMRVAGCRKTNHEHSATEELFTIIYIGIMHIYWLQIHGFLLSNDSCKITDSTEIWASSNAKSLDHWSTDIHSEISSLLWIPKKLHYHVHKSSPTSLILNHMNSDEVWRTLTMVLYNMDFVHRLNDKQKLNVSEVGSSSVFR
jgi:hypothetical protein